MADYYKVTYKTAMELDPPAIRSIYTNYTSFADITKIQLAWEDIDGLDITGWLFSFEVDGFVQITNADDENEFGIYKIILLNNNTDSPTNPYIEVEVAPTQINGMEFIPGTNNMIVSHWNNSGTPGTDGSSGTSGVDGSSGTSGVDGAVGPQGEAGPDGVDGAVGPQGDAGPAGVEGAAGPAGADGMAGVAGVDGVAGAAGAAGADGVQGIQGEIGPIGPQGEVGPQGEIGAGPLGGVDFDIIIAHLEGIVAELKKK